MEKTPQRWIHSNHYFGRHVRLIVLLSGYLFYIAILVLMVITINSENLSFPLNDLVFEILFEVAIDLSGVSLLTALLHEYIPSEFRVSISTFQIPAWSFNDHVPCQDSQAHKQYANQSLYQDSFCNKHSKFTKVELEYTVVKTGEYRVLFDFVVALWTAMFLITQYSYYNREKENRVDAKSEIEDETYCVDINWCRFLQMGLALVLTIRTLDSLGNSHPKVFNLPFLRFERVDNERSFSHHEHEFLWRHH